MTSRTNATLVLLTCFKGFCLLGCSREGKELPIPRDILDRLESTTLSQGRIQGRETAIVDLRKMSLPPSALERIWLDAPPRWSDLGQTLDDLVMEGLASNPSKESTTVLCKLVRQNEVPKNTRWLVEGPLHRGRVTVGAASFLKALAARTGTEVTSILDEVAENRSRGYNVSDWQYAEYLRLQRQ
ncbi:MAG: hypothetical protein FJY85_13460, partial [Deltaproteobacteria bacterium]|nr:hypothetical protein [Deltaproteobacteria bacterium]